MHILLLRFSSLGDVVMQTSMASWIKQVAPSAFITFVTAKEFTSLLDNHPHIDKVVGYERQKGLKDLINLRKVTRQIHKVKNIDFIIDLHGTTRSFFLKLLNPDIPCLNQDKRRIERQLLVKLKIDLLKKEKTLHERTIFDYQGFFDVKYEREHLESFITDLNKSSGSITSAPDSFKESNFVPPFKKYIVIAPVASFDPKRWPMEKFISFTKTFIDDKDLSNYSIAIVAGPSDDYVDAINHLVSEHPNRLINLKGKTNLKESSKVIRSSELVLGNDTGMGHIAESFGVPSISIFGPTSESFGFKPHRADSESISVDLWCRPCSTTGKKKCFRSKQYCMDNVTIERVLKSVKNKLLETS